MIDIHQVTEILEPFQNQDKQNQKEKEGINTEIGERRLDGINLKSQ